MSAKQWFLNHFRGALGVNSLQANLARMESMLSDHIHHSELRDQDLFLLMQRSMPGSSDGVSLTTSAPVAIDSDDHLFPRGTLNDNTRHLRFVCACERHFSQNRLKVLDLGCAGGGMVFDFHMRGHVAIGLEGSDASKLSQRAAWRLLPNNLFTCDITKPFSLNTSNGDVAAFDVITMWEVLEHIPQQALPSLFDNIRRHLAKEGLFVGSVSTLPQIDPVTGANYHVTVQPVQWWRGQMANNGLHMTNEHPFTHLDYCRGNVDIPFRDVDVAKHPEAGFHFVAKVI